MPLDQALVGSVVTGALALLSQAVAKCKCHVSCSKDEDDQLCRPKIQCGFLDSSLLEMSQGHMLDKSKDASSADET